METSGNSPWHILYAFIIDDMSEYTVHCWRSNCADFAEGCERDRLFIVAVPITISYHMIRTSRNM
jgi:hypothetical protein